MKAKIFTLAAVAFVAGSFASLAMSGYSVAINTTPSLDRGVYLVKRLSAEEAREIKPGTLVSVCVPAGEHVDVYKSREYVPVSPACPSGLSPLLKPVVAAGGDSVEITQVGTWVNDKWIQNSEVFDTDSQDKSIEHLPIGWTKKIEAGEYFLLATRLKRSLDSRYYGTVTWSDVIGQASPIFTFE